MRLPLIALFVMAASPALAQTAPGAPPLAPPHLATADEKARAERQPPLVRVAFWLREAEHNPLDADTQMHFAMALRAVGRWDAAISASGRALVLKPGNTEVLLELARDYLGKGDGFNALDPLRQAQKSAPKDWRVASLMAVAYDQNRQPANADAAFAEALRLSPENPQVLTNRALALAGRGQLAEAEADLAQAVKSPKATANTRQNYALILGLRGKYAEAETWLRQDLPPEAVDRNLTWLRGQAGVAPHSWDALKNG